MCNLLRNRSDNIRMEIYYRRKNNNNNYYGRSREFDARSLAAGITGPRGISWRRAYVRFDKHHRNTTITKIKIIIIIIITTMGAKRPKNYRSVNALSSDIITLTAYIIVARIKYTTTTTAAAAF